MVLDNEKASLQVGDDVPILTQSTTSQVTATPATVNSITYQQTGVILQVVPRVNAGGLVSLDISQEVSEPSTTASLGHRLADHLRTQGAEQGRDPGRPDRGTGRPDPRQCQPRAIRAFPG